jgi:hypothetical protein
MAKDGAKRRVLSSARPCLTRPDEPQYEGVIFSDGTVAVRWLTENPSHSIWPDFRTFYQIHGHPEYGTEIKWLDE